MRVLDPRRRGTHHVRVGQPWRQEVESLGDVSRTAGGSWQLLATGCFYFVLPPQFLLLSTFSSVLLSLLFSCFCFLFHFIDFLFQLCIVLLYTLFRFLCLYELPRLLLLDLTLRVSSSSTRFFALLYVTPFPFPFPLSYFLFPPPTDWTQAVGSPITFIFGRCPVLGPRLSH